MIPTELEELFLERSWKKFLLFVIAGIIAAFCVGCSIGNLYSRAETETGSDTFLYYLNDTEDRIVSEAYAFEDPDMNAEIVELIAMQSQEAPEDLHTLLPENVLIQDYQITDSTLTLDVNSAFASLDMTRKILAYGGLVRTFVQVEGIERVTVTVEGKTWTDSSGNEMTAMGPDDFVENAGKSVNAYQVVTMTLYFTDETGSKLLPETRRVYYSSNEPIEEAVVEELIKGPAVEGHYPVLSSDTKILNATSQDDACYVNFDSSLSSNLIVSVREEIPIYAIVNSLVDTCNVTSVQFTINGESNVVFRENMKLNKMYKKNEDLIAEE